MPENLDELLAANNISVDNSVTNSVIVTVHGQDQYFAMDTLGLTMESTKAQILAATQGIVAEMGQSLQDEDRDFVYEVVKATNSNNIYVVPKSDWASDIEIIHVGKGTPRKDVYNLIDEERNYQESVWSNPLPPSDELRLIQTILTQTNIDWYKTKDEIINGVKVNPADMNALRKIAAIAVRCMEHHGLAKR